MKQEQDGKISYEGFCIDLFKELAKMLHFTYEIYVSPDGQYGGITQKGTWNGIVGQLVNKVSTLYDKSSCHHQSQHTHEKTNERLT